MSSFKIFEMGLHRTYNIGMTLYTVDQSHAPVFSVRKKRKKKKGSSSAHDLVCGLSTFHESFRRLYIAFQQIYFCLNALESQ